MDTSETKAPPAPLPAPKPVPEPTVVEKATKSIATAKAGSRWLRPVRYGAAFVEGTFKASLDGAAHWGRKGLKIGAILGGLAYIGSASFFAGTALAELAAMATVMTAGAPAALLIVGAVGGMLALAAVAGGYGLLTGGVSAVRRVHRGEMYAEDLIVREKIRAQTPPNRADYREHRHMRKQVHAANSQQFLERDAEAARDASTYWQDRAHASSADHHRGL